MLSLDRLQGKVAVVTGASTGIGTTLTKVLVQAGLKVVWLAIKPETVQDLQLPNLKSQLYPFETDHSKETDIVKAFEYAKTLGPLHVLINNAGIMKDSHLPDDKSHTWKEVMKTSVQSLAIATREAVLSMNANHVQGHIVHINSVVGHQLVPPVHDYIAFKFAVTAITEMLRQELHNMGGQIKLSSVSPGLMNTDVLEVVPKQGPEIVKVEKEPMKFPALAVDDVAMAVRFVLSAPPHVQVNELILEAISLSV